MSASRKYDREWISKVPTLDEAFGGNPISEGAQGWVSSIQAWAAFAHSALNKSDAGLGQCEKHFPLRSLIGCLRVLAASQTIDDALLKLRTFTNIIDSPARIQFRTVAPTTFISLTLEGKDANAMENIEVFHLTLLMATLNWMVGKRIPYLATYSRSRIFHARHTIHPDFDCEVRLAEWTGVSMPQEWLTFHSVQEASEENMPEILSWLVFSN